MNRGLYSPTVVGFGLRHALGQMQPVGDRVALKRKMGEVVHTLVHIHMLSGAAGPQDTLVWEATDCA
jgi:hypothetical protein